MAPHGNALDLWHDLKFTQSDFAASRTATLTGTAMDTKGFAANLAVLEVMAAAGTLDTSNYYTVVLKECATSGGSYTAVADAQVIGPDGTQTNSATINNSTTKVKRYYRFAYLGQLRYIKLVATLTGTDASGTIIGTQLVQGNPLHGAAASTA